MLRIVRAEDGELFQVDIALWDLERLGNLEHFLQEQTGVEEDAVLAYLSDGTRLTSQNIRDLAGSPDDTIFVFNKLYLQHDLHEVLQELHVQSQLQPPIEDAMSSTPPFRPSQLAAAYLHAAHFHQDVIEHAASTIALQYDALGISSRSLDLHILSLSEAYDVFAQFASRELEKQALLLKALDLDLEILSKVQVHPDFLSTNLRRAIEGGGKARLMSDYVDSVKMRQVANGCAIIHDSFNVRFQQIQKCMDRLQKGSDEVRSVLRRPGPPERVGVIKEHVRNSVERMTDVASRLQGGTSGSDGLLLELKQIDVILRNEVESVTELKNSATALCIGALREISVLNDDILQLPILMNNLNAEFRAKNNFSHIHRLHSMLYNYGATLIEVVRRKEFARFFFRRSQTILEVMAKLTSYEQKRRQIYRSEVKGQLPFTPKGLEGDAPLIDFTPSGEKEVEYTIERGDVEAFMQSLLTFERDFRAGQFGSVEPLLETRRALEKLISRMDSLESIFDRIVERSLLSASRLSSSRRRIAAIEESALQDLSDKIEALNREKADLEATLSNERRRFEEEVTLLKDRLEDTREAARSDREQCEALEREIHSLKAQISSETQARKVLEQRHSELLTDVDALRKGQAEALAQATTQAKEADTLRQELARAHTEYEEVKQLEAMHSQKISQLIEDQTTTLRNLEEARLRGEDLQVQIQAARSENEGVNRALRDAEQQKDRLLRAQALEHERLMRDHIAEADGDRAVLEQQFFEVKALLDQNERHLKEAKSENEVLQADVTGLREELQRTEHELREARHNERVLRNDLSEGRASQSDYEQKIAERDRLVAQILDVAIAFRDSHSRAFAALQPLSVHPATVLKNGVNPSESVVLSPPRLPMSPLREESVPIDPTDPAAALEILRSYDLDVFSETVAKVGSVVRRWQKQCKEYRERSKGKITFRNFAKGDLALFLPTRNSVSKPWAAFNVSFPHYFLNATGRLAEQLKTREWIVARITSITERIVDAKDPSTNPYGLGDGVKYFLLEVEDWTKPASDSTKRRKSTNSARPNQDTITSSMPLERPISPPLPEDKKSGSAAEPLGPTRSPNSHLFPVRTRSNSTNAGPSSLSRLLAQAPVESQLETIPAVPSPARTRTPSPSTRPAPPSSPTQKATFPNSPSVSSPLRPGSRASGSSSSRLSFSGGRIAPFARGSTSGTPALAKAAPTTALSSDLPVASPPSSSSKSSRGDIVKDISEENAPERRTTGSSQETPPSPTHSASEAMATAFLGRRRTTSDHIPSISAASGKRQSRSGSPSVGTSATNALANLVGMTMSIGRGRGVESGRPDGDNVRRRMQSEPDSTAEPNRPASAAPTSSTVAELLRKF